MRAKCGKGKIELCLKGEFFHLVKVMNFMKPINETELIY